MVLFIAGFLLGFGTGLLTGFIAGAGSKNNRYPQFIKCPQCGYAFAYTPYGYVPVLVWPAPQQAR